MSMDVNERRDIALRDVISKAKAVRKGETFPFTCQRQFWERDVKDEIEFIYKHYTMAPSFFDEGKGYGTYGLEDAIAWYLGKRKDVSDSANNVRLCVREIADGNFFLSKQEMQRIREDINTNQEAKRQFEEMYTIATAETLEEVEQKYVLNLYATDYSEIKEKYNLWRPNGNGANFYVPESAVQGKIVIQLSPKDSEENGLGHIWLRNLCLQAETGELVYIEESTENTIYLENEKNGDSAVWTAAPVDIKGNTNYTLSFEAWQEGKFKEGVTVSIIFYDYHDACVGTYEYLYNKKSWIPINNYNLAMQCDAIVYMVTGDLRHARKAKIEMLHMLDDFCQGAYYWMKYNERPEGLDCYGAVQAGRNLCSLAVTYGLIEDADVFTEEEKKLLYRLIDFMLHYVLDLRDRTTLSFAEVQKGSGNWQTDMCIGASLMMFALPDFPNREIWLENAYAVIYGQLIINLNEDGSWPESIRYHYAVLEKFAMYAKVLKRMTGIDWFKETKLLNMFSYGIDIHTPAYEYFADCISSPPFGDHKLGDGSEFSIYGLYLNEAIEENPALADKMYQAWCMSGKKRKRLWGESIAVENLLYPTEYRWCKKQEIEYVSTDRYKDAGIYVFRDKRENRKEDYLAVMASTKKIGHGHLDQGAFVLYKDSVPVVMDSGIEGYFDVSTPWHISSYSHGCMLLETEPAEREVVPGFINLSADNYTKEHGYMDTPACCKTVSAHMGNVIETMHMEIDYEESGSKHIREFKVDHEKRIWTIKDEVKSFEGGIMFILPLVAKELTIVGNRVLVTGYYGITVEIEVLSDFLSMEVSEGRTTAVYPTDESQQYLKYLRIKANAESGFLVCIK